MGSSAESSAAEFRGRTFRKGAQALLDTHRARLRVAASPGEAWNRGGLEDLCRQAVS
jgi:hypothetical protein